ncbi:MAG: ACT domain-containing protein, partial [Sedimenticola sp.]
SFTEVVDVYAFRIVVDNLDTCYRVLGLMHSLYKPVPGRFKDYIAIPKSNGYQSLHTVLFGPYSIPIEIQIRTEAMHRVAESGIAAHWLYKSSESDEELAHTGAASWLKHLLELQQGAGDSMEFLEHVKIDLFPDEVYVFTPRGKILVLSKGSTVIDFAYAVHSDIGNGCVAARIDRRMVPLRSRLHSGQTVEVITSKTAHPSAAWLNYVVTGKARSNIRSYLKNLHRNEAVDLGRRLLEKELGANNVKLDEISKIRLEQLLADFKLKDLDALLGEVGLGNRMPLLVARRLLDRDDEMPKDLAGDIYSNAPPLAIQGTEGMVVKYAKCCRPLPGDDIVATFRPGSGIVVHRHECRNFSEFRKGASWLDVQWEKNPAGDFTTEIKVEMGDKRGVLASLAVAISEMGSNIENVNMGERDGLTSTLDFVITVDDRVHLAKVMKRLRHLKQVIRIYRATG